MSEREQVETWTIYRVRIGERGVGEWQVAGTEAAKRGVRTAHHTDVVEVVPASALQSQRKLTEEAEERVARFLEEAEILPLREGFGSLQRQVDEYREGLREICAINNDPSEDHLSARLKVKRRARSLLAPATQSPEKEDK